MKTDGENTATGGAFETAASRPWPERGFWSDEFATAQPTTSVACRVGGAVSRRLAEIALRKLAASLFAPAR